MLIYLKRVPSTSMLPGDSGRCWVVWPSRSGSGEVMGVVASEEVPEDVPLAVTTVGPREGTSTVPSPSMMVFLRLSWRRMMEDNVRLFRLPGFSPVGVGGRDRVKPEGRLLFGREEVGNMVPLVWALLLLPLLPILLGVEPVSIVFTTPWTTTNVPGGGKWRGPG